MAFSRVVFALLVISIVQSYASELAYFWGDLAKSNFKAQPLSTLNAAGFSALLNGQLEENPFVVCFIEKNLSPEDLSRRNADGETSFPFLEANLDDSLYIPSVQKPLRVLNEVADPETVKHLELTEVGLSGNIETDGKFLFINLNDAREGESRAELLRRHNDFMEDIFAKLKEKYGKVMAIYTSHHASWTVSSDSHSRVRRQSETQSNSNDWLLENLRIFVTAILLDDGTSETDLKALGLQSSSSSLNGTELNTTLVFQNNKVTLNFVSHAGYWLFNTISLTQDSPAITEELTAKTQVFSNIGWSYRCQQNVTFSTINDTRQYTLTFQNMKIQPYFDPNTNSTDMVFGDSYNCVGFFSAPIWASLFVVFILIAIMFYGIMMMLDIRTMDRFDDPKGKTITIITSE